jgi:hypothetical protein
MVLSQHPNQITDYLSLILMLFLMTTNHRVCIQSARLSLQSSEFAPPAPHPQARIPPPFGSGEGTHHLGGEGR